MYEYFQSIISLIAMKNISVVLITFCIVYPLRSMHLNQEHLGSAELLKTLKSQQEQITQSIDSLQKDIASTAQAIKSETDLTQKIRKMEQAIFRQKKLISQIQLDSLTPLQDIDIVCPNLNDTSQSQLKGIANDLEESTNSLKDSVAALDSDSNLSQLSEDSVIAGNYAEKISQTLNDKAQYKQPNKLDVVWISNLASDNWLRGDMTLDQVSKKYQSQADTADITKYCEIDKPFYDGKACIDCQNGQYFDLSTQKCLSCDSFNENQHICEQTAKEPTATNLQAVSDRLVLPPGQTITTVKQNMPQQAVSCPTQTPFYVDGKCIQCTSPKMLFNYTTNQCTSCPQNTIYEPSKARCLAQPKYTTNYIASPNGIIVPEGKTLDDLLAEQKKQGQTQNLQACPASTPFFNGQSCINCEDEGTYFDVGSLKCKECPPNTSYKKSLYRCIQILYYSNLRNSNWTSTNPSEIKSTNQQQKSNASYIQCPIEEPFFNGQKCIKCGQNQYFSFDAQTCSKCSVSTTFSVNVHQCVTPSYSSQTNPLTAPNLIYGGISKNQWSTKYYKNLEEYPNIADCPQQRPYYDGTVCVKCPSTHPYFNLRYSLCQSCESDSSYDEKSHECLSTEGGILDQTPNLQKMAAGIFS